MATQPHYVTPEEYLEIERKAEFKSEYINGVMVAMSGASLPHVVITGSAYRALADQLDDGPCQVFNSDLRVDAPAPNAYFYPDLSVCCGEPELSDEHLDALLNPVLIVEVLSPSTEAYNRGKKFKHYQTIPSLKEYLLLSSQSVGADLFTRQADGKWLITSWDKLTDIVELQSIGCRLPLAKVYQRVKFADTPAVGSRKPAAT